MLMKASLENTLVYVFASISTLVARSNLLIFCNLPSGNRGSGVLLETMNAALSVGDGGDIRKWGTNNIIDIWYQLYKCFNRTCSMFIYK